MALVLADKLLCQTFTFNVTMMKNSQCPAVGPTAQGQVLS